ncbi:ste ste20 paka protein kinase, partial [Moniliophthora roreri]
AVALSQDPSVSFERVIVGGGTTGLTVAVCLSEDPNVKGHVAALNGDLFERKQEGSWCQRTTAHYVKRKVQHLACKLKLFFDDNHNTLFLSAHWPPVILKQLTFCDVGGLAQALKPGLTELGLTRPSQALL